MSIPENGHIGAMYICTPGSQDQAIARLTEAMSLGKENNEQTIAGNLFGLKFNSFNQLIISLNQLGWFVQPKYLSRSYWATTMQINMSKGDFLIKIIVHGFGLNQSPDYVQIINVSHNIPGDDDE